MKKLLTVLLLSSSLLIVGCGENSVENVNDLQERGDKFYLPNSKEPYTGTVKSVYSDLGKGWANTEYSGSVKDGIWHGDYIRFCKNKQVEEKGEYEDGKKVGEWEYLLHTTNEEKIMTVYSYTRVSTMSQVEEGFSLEVQENDCKSYASMHKLLPKSQRNVICFREEGVSGGKPLYERQQGKNLLSVLKKGDHLICSKLDRLFRSPLDCCENLEFFKKNEINIHFIDLGGCITNGIGQLFVQIASSFAGYEKSRIQERIQDVKNHKQSQGEYQGGYKPLGYSIAKNRKGVRVLKIDEKEQKIIRTMKRMYKEGKSYRLIARTITKKYPEHLPNGAISHNGVRSVLQKTRKEVMV